MDKYESISTIISKGGFSEPWIDYDYNDDNDDDDDDDNDDDDDDDNDYESVDD